jgi:hypothetical protein
MPTRRVVKAVLGNFLVTYTSRYSDFQGYWLFGLVEAELGFLELDLLSSPIADKTPSAALRRFAIVKFRDQLSKSGLPQESLARATLTITKQPNTVAGWHGDRMTNGAMVDFRASVVLDNGREYAKVVTVFVAPHDPTIEWRRYPGYWCE